MQDQQESITQEQCLILIDDYLQGRADGKRHLAKELADLLDVNPVTISRWKSGKNMSIKTMRAIEFFCRKQIVKKEEMQSYETDQETTTSLQRIIDAIMSSDMCDGCKVKAFNIIKGVK